MTNNVKLTRNNIAYDLKLSPHKLLIKYDDNLSIDYIFSSNLYVSKFIERLEDNRESINKSLTKRFGYQITNNVLCDLNLYSKIEKRGFLVKINGDYAECQKDIILDGKNPTMKI